MMLAGLLQTRIDDMLKGVPDLQGRKLAVADIPEAGWNLLRGDLPFPVATLDADALRSNGLWMRRFAERHGVQVCPHGKTTMAPQLFSRQMADGAWGITVSTVQQMRVCVKHGVKRVLMANQLVHERDIHEVMEALRADATLDFRCLVDSADNVRRLRDCAEAAGLGRPLQVLIEGGVKGGRTGCRSLAEAMQLAELVDECHPLLALTGVEGFEGVIDATDDGAAAVAVDRFISLLCELMSGLAGRGLLHVERPVLTIGGSIFFDLVVSHPAVLGLRDRCDVVLRSGCYLTHDSLMLRDNLRRIHGRSSGLGIAGDAFRPALTVWGLVQSMPEPGLAIVNVGKRDVSHDIDLPIVERWFRRGLHTSPVAMPEPVTTTQINDQHLFLRVAAGTRLRIGDVVGLGVSHPCTTFDRWRLLHVIDERFDVVEGILTFF